MRPPPAALLGVLALAALASGPSPAAARGAAPHHQAPHHRRRHHRARHRPPVHKPPPARCGPPPAVPEPATEPVVTTGATEIITGIYLEGGPIPLPGCTQQPIGPQAGTVEVLLPGSTQVVASAAVGEGQLAVLVVPPGTYSVESTSQDLGQPFPVTVTVAAGQTVRQDINIPVP